jgi:hypothetical protein
VLSHRFIPEPVHRGGEVVEVVEVAVRPGQERARDGCAVASEQASPSRTPKVSSTAAAVSQQSAVS